jgi:hypothetical protein
MSDVVESDLEFVAVVRRSLMNPFLSAIEALDQMETDMKGAESSQARAALAGLRSQGNAIASARAIALADKGETLTAGAFAETARIEMIREFWKLAF